MTIRTVMDEMPARLQAAAESATDTYTAYMLAIRQRNRLIVEAVDGGMQQTAVARYAGVGQARINRILAKPDDDTVPTAQVA